MQVQRLGGGKAVDAAVGLALAVHSQQVAAGVAQKVWADTGASFDRGGDPHFLRSQNGLVSALYLLLQVQQLEQLSLLAQEQAVVELLLAPTGTVDLSQP